MHVTTLSVVVPEQISSILVMEKKNSEALGDTKSRTCHSIGIVELTLSPE